jgi:hypothetical protein
MSAKIQNKKESVARVVALVATPASPTDSQPSL